MGVMVCTNTYKKQKNKQTQMSTIGYNVADRIIHTTI